MVLKIHQQQVFPWVKKENAELIIINQWLPNSRDKVGNLTRKRSALMDSHRVCCPETYPRGFWAQLGLIEALGAVGKPAQGMGRKGAGVCFMALCSRHILRAFV